MAYTQKYYILKENVTFEELLEQVMNEKEDYEINLKEPN